MWQRYLQPVTLEETLDTLDELAGQARIIAGGTDVIVELQRGIRPTTTLIDISALQTLKYVRCSGGWLSLGALTTHNDVQASPDCVQYALPLVQACSEISVPQIRTRATIAGNLITASPANDTITPLIALDAQLVLTSRTGERVIPLQDFYTGVRRTVLQPDELVREIRIPTLNACQRGLFLKLGLRQAQAISVINIAFVLTFDNTVISKARITLGSVAPTIVHAHNVERFLIGKCLTLQVCQEAGQLAVQDVAPIDDIRASAAYRRATLINLVTYGLRSLASEATPPVNSPVLLEVPEEPTHTTTPQSFSGEICATINGKFHKIRGANGKTLLNALREDVGLTGTKEGCAEGECGACTVWLNGQAVMSCLVPTPQAHNASITTIEGLSQTEQLHPLQQAFIDQGAVQCGYCIPGMLMAGARLLDEHPHPDLEQIRTALSGNICRCTGYRKIIAAMKQAGGVA